MSTRETHDVREKFLEFWRGGEVAFVEDVMDGLITIEFTECPGVKMSAGVAGEAYVSLNLPPSNIATLADRLGILLRIVSAADQLNDWIHGRG